MSLQASIITIGDELLIGQTIDTNSAWLAQRLAAIGIPVRFRLAVGDESAEIEAALDLAFRQSDIVLTTGGLGPTADDITKPLLCRYFGGRLVENEAVAQHVAQIFAKRNRPMLEVNRKQAEVPDICAVLFNNKGTAPGMLFHKGSKVLIALPGVPYEMQAIMGDGGLERLSAMAPDQYVVQRHLVTVGEGESFLAARIADIEAQLPEFLKLAYLPQPGMVRLRLTAAGTDRQLLESSADRFQQLIAARLETLVVALEDIPIEAVVGQKLRDSGMKLAIAESCTGGFISHRITQLPGSSEFFTGTIVSYDNSVKIKQLSVSEEILNASGAVSEECAEAMARGALKALGTDAALAVTGILGPGGATPGKPVGMVCMSVADKQKTTTKTYYFHHDRQRNKEQAATTALLLLLQFLSEQR